jgi:hypothetical protein
MPIQKQLPVIPAEAWDQLMTPKELAFYLRGTRGAHYVYSMKAWGFSMPGGTATLREARAWLKENPDFRAGRKKLNDKGEPCQTKTHQL